MPNWVANELRISASSKEAMTAIRSKLFVKDENGNEYLSFTALIPEERDNPKYRVDPAKAHIVPDDLDENGLTFNWYAFHINKWGCKWDVSPDDCTIWEDTDESVGVSFNTPWSCPCEWYNALCEAFPGECIELVGMDEAMDYYWENGTLGSIADRIDEKQAKRIEFERVFDENNKSIDDYDLEKIIDEYDDGYFSYPDMFDPSSWEYCVDDDDSFLEFCESYKK